jgi:hypothetical protein
MPGSAGRLSGWTSLPDLPRFLPVSGSGSVVTWRPAQMVLWSAQRMNVAQIAKLAFTSEDRVRDVLHNFNADGFESLYPRYAGGRPAHCAVN